MSEILSTIKNNGSVKQSNSMIKSNSSESVGSSSGKSSNNTSSTDFENIKQKEIEKLTAERNTRRLAGTKLGAGGPTNKQAFNNNNNNLLVESSDLTNNGGGGGGESGRKVTLKEFNMIKLVGKGSFGKVFLVTSKTTN